ncbi:MAG TPA: SDR family oxidoreductase [Terriglobales bacterium]|nr:SDR family oxidoreductase [Terriglobales bacterium]
MSGISLSLKDRVAVVSGGSRGIGAATVRMFVAAGAKIVFNYRSDKKAAQRVVKECGEAKCCAVQIDLDSPSAGRKLVAAAVQRFGRVDILVANHGVWPAEDVPIEEMSDEQWRHTLAVNVDAVFGLVKHSVAQMKSQSRKNKRAAGHIVIISSTSGQRGEAFHCDYSASKGAMISFTKSLAAELASQRIYVNCVAPGWVMTDMSAPALNDSAVGKQIKETIPLGRVGTPEEIAAPILFLCTEHAGFITGEVFNVNGGAVLFG